MSVFDSILRDLRERRLWPVALVLLAALVAVPVMLSKPGQAAAPPAAPTPPSATASAASALPAVSVTTVPRPSRLNGQARDPFAQQQATAAAAKTAATTPGATTPTTTSTTGTTPTNTGASATGGTSGTGAPNSSGPGSGSTTPKFPTVPSKPAPPALTATQSYHVTVAITNAVGGLDTIDPLQRLSGLPSDQLPLLIELGVLKGGHRALFVVQPGTVVSGPGACSPGPIDCQILSLAQDQIETLSTQSSTGSVQAAQFAVTAIKAHDEGSAAAANKARRSESSVGRRLLANSTPSALSLFQYEPSLGAVVDLRNLTVGGS
jgi:hypothetical protein